MKKTSDVICCVKDLGGMYIHVARRLAKEFKKVYYTTQPEDSFKLIGKSAIGDGYPEIQWVESIWDVSEKIDLAVFCDIGLAAEQEKLRRDGVAVWGSARASKLESRRGLFLRTLAKTNLPVPEYEEIKGVTNLRLFLQDKSDKYIKVSEFRGNFQTTHWRSMDEDYSILDNWEIIAGPFKERLKFYVLDDIPTEIEGGSDGWNVDGRWPNTFTHGFEKKDQSYLMTFVTWDDMPEEVRIVNEEFGPILESYGYRGPFSTEVRITDKKSYFTDPTCRFASPVSQAQCDMLSNLGEVVWMGASGILVDAQYEEENRFGVQAVFKCDRDEWVALKIPPEIESHVKVSASCMMDGMIWVTPDDNGADEVGWLCATGSTIEWAIHNLKAYAEKLPSGIEVRIDSLVHLLNEAKEAGNRGMKFAEDVPGPEIVNT